MLKNFIYEEDGLGTIEIAILIAALVALAVAFRSKLKDILDAVTGKLTNQSTYDRATDVDNL